MEPIRILHVVGTMDFGGVETLIMNLYRNIDREKVQFDFLCHNSSEGKYVPEIRELGGRVFNVNTIIRSGGIYFYKKSLQKFFSAHSEYRIIHCHKSGNNGYPLLMAKKAGIPVRISHSHIADVTFRFPYSYFISSSMKIIPDVTTDFFACSKDAARYLYKSDELVDKTVIMSNAIDTEKFTYNQSAREKIRSEYGIGDKTLYAHTGRFMEQKNHRFLIDVFAEIKKLSPDSALILLGGGPLESEIREKVTSLGLENDVIFAGSHPNIPDYMSAADCFLFPSLYEGLGIVAVEAQASGLPVFASDTVPVEAKRTELLEFLPLADSAAKWAERIVTKTNNCRSNEVLSKRTVAAGLVKDSGYDIKDTAKRLEEFYIRRYNEML